MSFSCTYFNRKIQVDFGFIKKNAVVAIILKYMQQYSLVYTKLNGIAQIFNSKQSACENIVLMHIHDAITLK